MAAVACCALIQFGIVSRLRKETRRDEMRRSDKNNTKNENRDAKKERRKEREQRQDKILICLFVHFMYVYIHSFSVLVRMYGRLMVR